MDRAISLDSRRIELSIERPFQLGGARVDPRSHEIAWNDESRRLQPLTMKVLVALHDKAGEVVTRDELVDRCWDGRFVGEDVINRCISLLRRVASESGGFEIQTVPRAGYRLAEAECLSSRDDPVVVPAEAHSKSPGRGKYWLAGGAGVALILVGGGGLFAFERLERPVPAAVMLEPFDVAGNAPLARTFAAGVSSDVNTALSAAGVDVIDPGPADQTSGAAFVLSGRAELPDSNLHVTAQLQDARDHTVPWSTDFTRPANQMRAMQEQVSANLAAVLQCALDTSQRPGGVQLDQSTTKLYLRACALQQAVDTPSDQIQSLLQQVTAREPRFAAGWARLALFAANAAFGASPQDAAKFHAEAWTAVRNALRLDPKSGTAYDAVSEMRLGHVPFAVLFGGIQKVLSLDPDDQYAMGDECELLLRMGSLDDSLRMCRRRVQLAPLAPETAADLVTALIDESRNSEAQATLDRALRIWPDDNRLKFIHLDYEARFGDPNAALSIISDSDARPQLSDVTFEVYRHLIAARKSGRPEQARAFTDWLEKKIASNEVNVEFGVPMLAGMGDVDGAFKLALAGPEQSILEGPDPAFLWEPDSSDLRRDARFVALAAKLHVADFWPSTGRWPDFCETPNWPYNCKAIDGRLRANSRAKA